MVGGLAKIFATMKFLYLVRHAKSSWDDSSLADRERPLNKRGYRDAPEMGRRLAARKVALDAIWSSPARRADETARLLAKALSFPRKKISHFDDLYDCTAEDLFRVLRNCPDKVDSLLVVGHNPAVTDFADQLISDQEDEIDWMPTCCVVALQFSFSSWQELRKEQGRLLFLDFPKKR